MTAQFKPPFRRVDPATLKRRLDMFRAIDVAIERLLAPRPVSMRPILQEAPDASGSDAPRHKVVDARTSPLSDLLDIRNYDARVGDRHNYGMQARIGSAGGRGGKRSLS